MLYVAQDSQLQAHLVLIYLRTTGKRDAREAGEEERKAKVARNERPRRRKKSVCRRNRKGWKRRGIEMQRRQERTASTKERRPNAVMFWVPGAGVIAGI